MAFANMSLLWLFAGRNNVFIWATGWSFAAFNIFHRHTAWIATVQAVIHTLAYLALFIQSKQVFICEEFKMLTAMLRLRESLSEEIL